MTENQKLHEIMEEIDFNVTTFIHGNKLNKSANDVLHKISSIIFQQYLPLKDGVIKP